MCTGGERRDARTFTTEGRESARVGKGGINKLPIRRESDRRREEQAKNKIETRTKRGSQVDAAAFG